MFVQLCADCMRVPESMGWMARGAPGRRCRAAAQDDREVEHILPAVPVADWLLEQCPELSGDDVVQTGDSKGRECWIQPHTFGLRHRFVEAYLARDGLRTIEPSGEFRGQGGLVGKGVSNGRAKGGEVASFARKLIAHGLNTQSQVET